MKGIVFFSPLYGKLDAVASCEARVLQKTIVHGTEGCIVQNLAGKKFIALNKELRQLGLGRQVLFWFRLVLKKIVWSVKK